MWQLGHISHGEVKEQFQMRILEGERELNGFEKRCAKDGQTHRCGITEKGEVLFEDNKIPFPLDLKFQGTFWYIRENKYEGRRYFVEPTLGCIIRHKAGELRKKLLEKWNNKFGE